MSDPRPEDGSPTAVGAALSVAELAATWSTSEQVIRRLLHDGELRGVKIGRSWRVFPQDAASFVEARSNRSSTDDA